MKRIRGSAMMALFGLVIVVVFAACQTGGTETEADGAAPTGACGGEAGVPTVTAAPVSLGTDGEAPQLEWPSDEEFAPDVWVPDTGDFVLQDLETGTLWNLRGEAIAGELSGETLTQLPAFNAYWFGWSVFHHGDEIWNRDVRNQPGELESGEGECLVRCDEIKQSCISGQDCIPSLNAGENLNFADADDREADYVPDDGVVLGVYIDGEARAYPHNILWWHEIANDQIGDHEFSVTYCPLTESGIVFSRDIDGHTPNFGISGQLYNSNLVMYDHRQEAFFSQLLGQQVTGEEVGRNLEHMPVVETTWKRWKQMHPDTSVVTQETGFQRDYDRYPYDDYRTNDEDTFRPTNPLAEEFYRNKDIVLSVVGEDGTRAYPFPEFEEHGQRVVLNDEFEGQPEVIVYEDIPTEVRRGAMAIPFSASVDGQTLTFVGHRVP